MRSGLYGVAATLVLLASVWLLLRITRRIQRSIGRRWLHHGSLRVQNAEIMSGERIGHTIDLVVRIVRAVAVLLLVDLYLTYTLGLFPWTRAVLKALVGYVITPFRAAGVAFIAYLPKLLFVAVIGGIIYF